MLMDTENAAKGHKPRLLLQYRNAYRSQPEYRVMSYCSGGLTLPDSSRPAAYVEMVISG
jgi:hypothetical protein